MGNVLSLLSSVPMTYQAPREVEEPRSQEPETFQVECAVCLTDKTIFRKMHHSWNTETGNYVCLGCFWAWKRACAESRAEFPECEQLTCPLCGVVECYTSNLSLYVACFGCRAVCETEYLSGGGFHLTENHPGCVLCWQCITEAEECPICGLEGPLLDMDDNFEYEWAQAQ